MGGVTVQGSRERLILAPGSIQRGTWVIGFTEDGNAGGYVFPDGDRYSLRLTRDCAVSNVVNVDVSPPDEFRRREIVELLAVRTYWTAFETSNLDLSAFDCSATSLMSESDRSGTRRGTNPACPDIDSSHVPGASGPSEANAAPDLATIQDLPDNSSGDIDRTALLTLKPSPSECTVATFAVFLSSDIKRISSFLQEHPSSPYVAELTWLLTAIHEKLVQIGPLAEADGHVAEYRRLLASYVTQGTGLHVEAAKAKQRPDRYSVEHVLELRKSGKLP